MLSLILSANLAVIVDAQHRRELRVSIRRALRPLLG